MENQENREKSWGEIGGRIFSSVVSLAEGYARNAVEKQKEKAVRSLLSYAAFAAASLFLLNGLALLLTQLLRIEAWGGYFLIGLVLFVVALLIPKKENWDDRQKDSFFD